MRGRTVTLWLVVMTCRQLGMAWLLYSERDRYEAGASFLVVLQVMPMWAWALLWALSGVLGVIALATHRLRLHLLAIIGAVMLTGYWTMSFIFAAAQVRTASKLLALVFGALTLKDLLLLHATAQRAAPASVAV